jgi:hypothetical protein
MALRRSSGGRPIDTRTADQRSQLAVVSYRITPRPGDTPASSSSPRHPASLHRYHWPGCSDKVVAVTFGDEPTEKKRFVNKLADIWWS